MASIVLKRTIYRSRVVLLERSSERFIDLTDKGVDVTRKATIRDEIAQRLRRVCGHLPETDFQSLVDEIAERQLRGERRANDYWSQLDETIL